MTSPFSVSPDVPPVESIVLRPTGGHLPGFCVYCMGNPLPFYEGFHFAPFVEGTNWVVCYQCVRERSASIAALLLLTSGARVRDEPDEGAEVLYRAAENYCLTTAEVEVQPRRAPECHIVLRPSSGQYHGRCAICGEDVLEEGRKCPQYPISPFWHGSEAPVCLPCLDAHAPLLLGLLNLSSRVLLASGFGPFDSDAADILEASLLYKAMVWDAMPPEIREMADAAEQVDESL